MFSEKMTKRFSTAAAALALISAPAFALNPTGSAETSVSGVTVAFADLNLERAEGATTLYQRISAAAEHVCGDAPGREALWERRSTRACMDQAIDEAVRTVDNANLDRIHRS